MRPSGRQNGLRNLFPDLEWSTALKSHLRYTVIMSPAVQYSYNNKKSDAAKHINIKYYVAKEKIQNHTISLEHVSTKQMLADPFTKGLPPKVFKEHIAGMGLRESL
jgi:hypothetical protein